jgi:4-amino-4-deoxy-L-arabinose transferase-like glycosyltransferase
MARVLSYLKKHPEAIWLLAILALSTLLRLAFLHEPFDRDEGQYATIAQVILRGGLPYRDAIEIKPPGTFYLYALAIGLFGATIEAVRTFTALYAMLTVIAVYGVARHISGARAGLCAALIYGIFSTVPRLQGNCNTEVFLVLPMTAGVWFFLKAFETKKRSYLFWAGLCAALAMLIKPVALPVVALEFLLIPFFRSGTGRWKDSALDLASFLLPIAACAMATIAYFFLRGGLDDFLYWTVEFPRRYKDAEIFSTPALAAVAWHLRSVLVVPALLGIPAALWLAATKRTIPSVLPLLLILAVSWAIALPGKNFPHYFLMIIPFLAIPGGIAVAQISSIPRIPACLALLIVTGTLVFSVFKNYKFYTVYSPDQVVTAIYGTTIFVDSVKVASYLREKTRPDDYIFQWGFEPELYFLSGRRCPNSYLVQFLPAWSRDSQQAIAKMKQSLRDKKPAYIVLQPEWSDFEGIYEVNEYIRDSCYEENKIGYARIFRCSR